MLAPLVRMLSDHAERCREICVGILAESLARMPEPTELIPAIMPALAARHGASPVQVNMAAVQWVSKPMLLAHAAIIAVPNGKVLLSLF